MSSNCFSSHSSFESQTDGRMKNTENKISYLNFLIHFHWPLKLSYLLNKELIGMKYF